MSDETIIHCPHGHPCEWLDAEPPDPECGCHGSPPMWYCYECGWESSAYRSHDEYVQVRREERIESNLGYTI